MTHEQWVKMSPPEQRVKIAELCGWKFDGTRPDGERMWCSPTEVWKFTNGETGGPCKRISDNLPDYLNDLNAMQQTHQVLHDAERFEEYVRILASLSKGHTTSIVKVAEATAEQQAEAFVLTMTQEEMK